MNILSLVPPSVSRVFGRGALIAQQKAPEILLGLGIGTGLGATFLACKASTKVERLIEKVKCDQMELTMQIGNMRYKAEHGELPEGETYTEAEAKRDAMLGYFQGAWAVARLYLPAVGLGIVSIGLLTQSHRILNKRNLALAGAYAALETTFEQYKNKVATDFGVDPIPVVKEVVGELTETAITTGENGEAIVTEKKTPVVNLKPLSQYAVMYDERSSQWQNDRLYNMNFLQSQQNWLNDLLKARGYLFLNEVYDHLGLPLTEAGQLVGWLYGEDREKDGYATIGWDHPRNDNRNMDNPNPPFLLDFNVDGMIFQKIN